MKVRKKNEHPTTRGGTRTHNLSLNSFQETNALPLRHPDIMVVEVNIRFVCLITPTIV